MKKNFDCIVIGYGPVGALLSIFLSKLGLSVAVIDKNLDVYPLPRAIPVSYTHLTLPTKA